jgi:hypothetical protein
MSEPGRLPALRGAPHHQILTVRALLQRLMAGGLRLEFQAQRLRWSWEDSEELFASVLRGFPLGLLTCRRGGAQGEGEVEIGKAALTVPANADVWWLLDGRERVLTLAAALLELPQPPQSAWRLWLDPTTGRFTTGEVPPAEQGRGVPLEALGDPIRLLRWMQTCLLNDAQLQDVLSVQQRLLEAELPVCLVDADDDEAVAEVVTRTNRTGVALSREEMFQTLFGGEGGKVFNVDLDELGGAYDLQGFGELPTKEALKALMLCLSLPPNTPPEHLSKERERLRRAAFDVSKSASKVVSFLQAPSPIGVGIPVDALLPYPALLPLLTLWFHKLGDDEHGNRLSRWVWRTIVAILCEDVAARRLNTLHKCLWSAGSAEEALDRLERSIQTPARIDWTLRATNRKSAHTRVEVLALLSLRPKNPKGSPVSFWENEVSRNLKLHIVVPQNTLQDAYKDVKALGGSVANWALLNSRKPISADLLSSLPFAEHRAFFLSHLIDEESHAALARQDYTTFLRHRGSQLQALVSRFLSSRAGLDDPTLAPLSRYVDDEPLLDEDEP